LSYLFALLVPHMGSVVDKTRFIVEVASRNSVWDKGMVHEVGHRDHVHPRDLHILRNRKQHDRTLAVGSYSQNARLLIIANAQLKRSNA
jgi:hypothetical protein